MTTHPQTRHQPNSRREMRMIRAAALRHNPLQPPPFRWWHLPLAVLAALLVAGAWYGQGTLLALGGQFPSPDVLALRLSWAGLLFSLYAIFGVRAYSAFTLVVLAAGATYCGITVGVVSNTGGPLHLRGMLPVVMALCTAVWVIGRPVTVQRVYMLADELRQLRSASKRERQETERWRMRAADLENQLLEYQLREATEHERTE